MTHSAQALRVHRDLVVDIGDIPERTLPPGEVRIRVGAAGICGSDIHAVHTGAWIEYWPATLGHEVAGTVVESENAELSVGTRVVVDSRIPCRACADCAVSPRFCPHLTWLGESRPGGFAEELVVPATVVYPITSDELPIDVAVLAEPLAVVLTAVARLPRGTRTVLIMGYGPIGALCHLVLRDRGIEVTVAETHPGRLATAVARGALSADVASDRIDVVIDSAGFPGSVKVAFGAVRRGGTVLVVAIGGSAIDISAQDLVEKCVTIAPSIGFHDDSIPAALTALIAEPGAFADVVSDRITLEELPARLSAPAPTLGKVVVTFP